MIGTTISHYKILEKLGEGGMGVVYKARDLKLDRLVALKFLSKEAVGSREEIERFRQEAKTISALNHPNIATIHDIEQINGDSFLVLEYLPGGTLKSNVKTLQSSGRFLPLPDVVKYGVQVAEALAHAHRHGIIHRDIKTDNLMLTEEGTVKLTDFGLAKLKGISPLTKAGSTAGTAAYMSPEQIRGQELDHRSDIFSFGIVLFELATGNFPFRGDHEAAVSYAIVNEDPIPLKSFRPSLPAALEIVVQRCLEKDVKRRYQNAEEITAELRSLHSGISARMNFRSPRAKRLGVVAAATILLLVIGFIVFLPQGFVSSGGKSIAVIPFDNFSDNKENEYFGDGITEDILTQLSKIQDLIVISRMSTVKYKGTKETARQIGEKLNVSTILKGSVQRSGNRVRIAGQLIDTRNDQQLWADTYDREMKDIFNIQSDVAQKIAAALRAKLSPTEQERIEKKPTENLEAYGYYLRGREYYYRYHKQDNDNAIALFRKAVALDPNYALAFAGLSDAYGQGTQKFGFGNAWADSAIAMAEKAITLDQNLAEAYKALGLAYGEKGWDQKSREAFHKAAELNPSYYPAVANIGWINWWDGRLDEAIPWMKKAAALNPSFAYNYAGLGFAYLSVDDQLQAKKYFEKALDLQPDITVGEAGLALLYVRQGNLSDAVNISRRILSTAPEDLIGLSLAGDIQVLVKNYPQAMKYYRDAKKIDPMARNFLTGRNITTPMGYVYWVSGSRAEARKMFKQSLQVDLKELDKGNEWWAIPYDIAALNAIQGNKPEAIRWVQKAVDAGWKIDRMGSEDPLLENLRLDEQFQKIAEVVRLKVADMRKRMEEMENQ